MKDCKLFLVDVMGTLVPISHIQERIAYTRREEVLVQISERTGESEEELTRILHLGIEARSRGQKDSPAFRDYIGITDLGSEIGYRQGDLKMPLVDGAQDILSWFHSRKIKVAVFSNSGMEGIRIAMRENGLSGYIDEQYSSSDESVGSKYSPRAYLSIAAKEGLEPSKIRYVTDDAKEADAAVRAGIGEVILISPGAGEQHGYVVLNAFSDIRSLIGEPTR